MAAARSARSQNYTIRTTFRVPLEYAFRWCTDYSGDDARLEGEKFQRRVLHRRARQVVYEDMEWARDGWLWSHWTVTLRPPDRWHAEAIGSRRNWTVDYTLRARSERETEFTFQGRRTPAGVGSRNPSKAELHRSLTRSWKRFGRAMEADYRRRRSPRRAGRPTRQ